MSTEIIDLDESSVPLEPAGGRPSRQPRIALWTFVAVEIFGFVFYSVIGRHLWFRGDDWDFLAARHVSVHDLLESHGGHLVALPVLIYRVLYSTVGLHSYLPYQLLAIGTHLAVAALLLTVIRRQGVDVWIATAAASLFVLFGRGAGDIVVAFQITFSMALLFGLVQLLLADHDGPLDRRDWLAVAAGLAALCCSGVGVAMVILTGVATLIRRGWKIAAFHTVPLGMTFAIWLHFHPVRSLTTTDPGLLTRWVLRGVTATFDGLSEVHVAGWLLEVILVVGLGLAVRSWDPADRRRRAAVPLAFVAGSLTFLVFSGYGRALFGIADARASRYLYIYGALILPPIAVAVDAFVRRRRFLLVPMILLLLVGIPGNISRTSNNVARPAAAARQRLNFFSLARMELARQVPRGDFVDLNRAPEVTVGWLLDGVRDGHFPKPARAPTRQETASMVLQLSLAESPRAAEPRTCPPLHEPRELNLAKGASLTVHGKVAIQLLDGAVPSIALPFGDSFSAGIGFGHKLTAVVQPLHLRVVPRSKNASIC